LNIQARIVFKVFLETETVSQIFSAVYQNAVKLASPSSNFTPQVKEARNQSQIFNRKLNSRNTTHRQSYHLQAMLTGVKRRKANTSSEKVNNLKTAKKKLRRPNRDK